MFLLSSLLMLDETDLVNYISRFKKRFLKLVLLINVGQERGPYETFISTPQRPGCHWTTLYIDYYTNTWTYCDTKASEILKGLRKVIEKIFFTVAVEMNLPVKGFTRIDQVHVVNDRKGGGHVCRTTRYPNFLSQTCGEICGIACSLQAFIAALAPNV